MPVFWPDLTGRHRWRGFQPVPVESGIPIPWTPTTLVADGERPLSAIDEHVLCDRMGWFTDPCGAAELRFFTGTEWTHWVADGTTARPTSEFRAPLHTESGPFDDELGLTAGDSVEDVNFEVFEYLDDY